MKMGKSFQRQKRNEQIDAEIQRVQSLKQTFGHPPLEKIHVTTLCQYSSVEYQLSQLQRNQEKIYKLLIDLNEKIQKPDVRSRGEEANFDY